MLFNPPRQTGIIIGIAAITVLLIADVFFVILLAVTGVSLFSAIWVALLLISLPILALLTYRAYGLVRSGYFVSQNALTITWGDLREVIPMAAIEGIALGRDVEATLLPRGLWWPGCYVGHGKSELYGPLVFFSAAGQDDTVLIKVEGGAYIISPNDVESFARAFAAEREKGITEPVDYATHRAALFKWDLWRSRWALVLIVAALLLVLTLFAFVAWQLPLLPAQTPLRFDASRQPTAFGPASRLLLLPALGGVIWLFNSVLGVVLHGVAKERLAAWLLWSGGLLAQLFLWVAIVALISAV